MQDDFRAELRDHLGRVMRLDLPAQRIVSLCPSQTETLFHLGAGSRVAGRTRFCIHPEPEISAVPAVGGTKKVSFGKIRGVSPDLILGEKEENTPDMVESLSKSWPVFVTDVKDFDSALRMIADIGRLVGTQGEAYQLIRDIGAAFDKLQTPLSGLRTAYLIWRKPYMAAGADTFIHSMLQKAGLENVFAALPGRYPEIDAAALQKADPQLVLLSSEPYPFADKHLQEIQDILPKAKVELTDGEMWSWYGSRMLLAAEYLQKANNRWAQQFP